MITPFERETPAFADEVISPLLSWLDKNGRSLPWRDAPTPYHVWISEIMLQQTRTAAVIPYYERFLTELPDVAALAAVSEERLMKLWEGLGYYSRARNLKRAAERILTEYGGKLPASVEALRSLPGIGAYTAGAIASIAFGLPEPAVDGNVLRVLMRYYACDADVTEEKTKRLVADFLRARYPTGKDAARLTEALMQLGELVCIPNGEPLCEHCPLSERCAARLWRLLPLLPARKPKKPRRVEERVLFLCRRGDGYLIRKRQSTGLLASLWEFPSLARPAAEQSPSACLAALGIRAHALSPIGDATHIFTHVEWHMHGYLCEADEVPSGYVVAKREELKSTYAIPSAFRFFLDHINKTESKCKQ